MNTNPVFQNLQEKRLVPVAVINSVDEGLRLSEALLKAGLNLIEITLRTAAAFDAIAAIGKEFPQMLVGAGTVLEVGQVEKLADLNARFLISPGVNADVIKASQTANIPVIPGIVTPTELQLAFGLGCKTLKFFPAEPSGGTAMLKTLIAAYAHTGVTFIPTGGINAENALKYWKIPQVMAVGGSWFIAPELIKKGDFTAIEQLTALSLENARSVVGA